MTDSAGAAPIAFTPRQLEAIEHERGPMEVLAGHGTGKTALLTERNARLIEKRLAWKYDILQLTFTRRAAVQMRERLQLRLSEDVDNLPIYTIHALCRVILQGEFDADKDKPFRVYDPVAAFRVLRRAMADAGAPENVWNPAFVAQVISDAKEWGIGPAEFVTVPDSVSQQVIARVYRCYQELLAEENGFDFDDLIFAAANLLESKPELLARLHEQHRFIQVDEWQDSSVGQYRLIRLLTGPEANLFVVGSESQSIYEWRQANYSRLAQFFCEDFPQARKIVLEDNFRSTNQIVNAARALFNGRYHDVDLVAHRGPGEPVQDVRLLDEYSEAAFVAAEAHRLHEAGIPWREMALLYRTRGQGALFEQEFLRHSIPYVLTQGQRLYYRREVGDVLAYLAVAESGDEAALTQIVNTPPRGLGPVSVRAIKGMHPYITWDQLFKVMTDGQSMKLRPKAIEAVSRLYDLLMDLESRCKEAAPAEFIDYVIEKSGYRAWLLEEFDGEERLASIRDLQREAAEHHATPEFLAAIKAKLAAEAERPDDSGVTLSTIHSVKGLQFRVVFVAGIEEGLLPHAKSSEGGSDEEGERRLAHVAMTRAQDSLYLVSAQSRERGGHRIDTRPSRYLFDLPRDAVVRGRWTP